ncbi:MAG: hypothetical protein U0U67_06380 [Chitinophagales bacterium]
MEDTFNEKTNDISHQLNCKDCGAMLLYSPGAQKLVCKYCGAQNNILSDEKTEIKETDYNDFINNKIQQEQKQTISTVKCNNCGASTTLKPNITSDNCAFCASPLVIQNGTTSTIIKPSYVLPFKIDSKNAHDSFTKWLNGLWFAPNDLKKYASLSEKLKGMYMPYWTYDAKTDTQYQGERGDYYYTTERRQVTVNGKTEMRTEQVRHTRWSYKSGTVFNTFDDVSVLASNSLPDATTRNLEPWDFNNLAPYNEGFISGFQTECYQVEVKDGFETAKKVMRTSIENSVRRDISGDEQRISNLNTNYNAITFKHILLPIWISAYQYNGKVYRFIINGRSGKLEGQRPYSWIKITLAVLAVLIIIGTIIAVTQK